MRISQRAEEREGELTTQPLPTATWEAARGVPLSTPEGLQVGEGLPVLGAEARGTKCRAPQFLREHAGPEHPASLGTTSMSCAAQSDALPSPRHTCPFLPHPLPASLALLPAPSQLPPTRVLPLYPSKGHFLQEAAPFVPSCTLALLPTHTSLPTPFPKAPRQEIPFLVPQFP